MENARIVTLAPSENPSVKVATFEEAFGAWEESSEFRGRGRARRQARKMDRMKKRQERKMTRKAMKAERKRAKQDLKDEKMERRLSRRSRRKAARLERKAMGEEMGMSEQDQYENGSEGGYTEETGGGSDSGYQDSGSDSGYQDSGSDSGYQDSGSDSGYQDSGSDSGYQDSGSDSGYQDSGSDSGSGYEETVSGPSYESGPSYAEEGGFDEGYEGDSYELEEPTYGEEEYEGEPVDYSDDAISEDESSFNGEANDGKVKVHPKVKQAAMNLERYKVRLKALEARKIKLTNALTKPRPQAEINRLAHQLKIVENQIANVLQKISEIEGRMSNFCNADGGKYRKPRLAQVHAAKKAARSARENAVKGQMIAMGHDKLKRKLVRKNHGGSETPVDPELNPEFGPQSIVIPAASLGVDGSQTGKGLIALDARDDYDAPEDRVFELKSNADGTTNKVKVDWGKVAIGVGVGVLAVVAIRAAMKTSK